MTPTDEVDELLARAGARWRADQPSPPEPDLERITGRRAPRRWVVPALAAASVAVIATAALVVLPDRSEPPLAIAPGNDKEHPLLVRDGDRVAVDGQVVAAPGEPVQYCLPVSMPTPYVVPGEQRPACAPGESVEVTGVDLEKLANASTIQGVTTGQAHLVGVWNGGKIAVDEQSAPRPPASEQAEKVPCAAPTGGWKKGDASLWITPAVESFVRARSGQLQNAWIGWPEGFPTDTTPGAPPTKPSVVMIGVARGDLGQVRRALDPLVAGNLCVTQVKLSQAEAAKQHAAVEALPRQQLGIASVGLGAGDKPVQVTLRVLDEKTLTALRPTGLDTLDLDTYIKPAP
ncbi:hypothetical protein Kfla_5368 [Kribbella flavida DSM 17836]|uniref:Uncharacterized protein n=1 Tax=Kribbella flavida (strain DSM 17836 / JCM 10339 / NBRC 14399) TaxID=479435 RepID=D2PM13_KRIFD|nr:hypothetical protein [Kribbella flavida]ADB34381.1 hypothetical protein Kfla_5368 [Kribbella flavida DSM 17836]